MGFNTMHTDLCGDMGRSWYNLVQTDFETSFAEMGASNNHWISSW